VPGRLVIPGGLFVPTIVEIAILAVAVGALVLLKLMGGSLPWGHLLIAVGPDGRLMRPRVKWHLWSISFGESPKRAALAGLASVCLGLASLVIATPWLLQSFFRPVRSPLLIAVVTILSIACVLIPTGVAVLVRGLLDIGSRRSSMAGRVVGLRRDFGLFGRAYHVAIQAGDQALTKGLWAESFKVDRETFARLSPGDRLSIEYSPRLHYVYQAVSPVEKPQAGHSPARPVEEAS
jgi:hypothetical protein